MNLQLNEKLVDEAVRLGKHRTKKSALSKALTEYVKALRQQRIIEAFGEFDFDPQYDYKAQRLYER